MITEVFVLLGSSTSNNAEAGSPRKSAPNLSTSSSSTTGLLTLGRLSVLEDTAGHGTYVGCVVPTDLCLISMRLPRQSEQRVFPSRQPRFVPMKSSPLREDLPSKESDLVSCAAQFQHGQMLQEPVFDFFNPKCC